MNRVVILIVALLIVNCSSNKGLVDVAYTTFDEFENSISINGIEEIDEFPNRDGVRKDRIVKSLHVTADLSDSLNIETYLRIQHSFIEDYDDRGTILFNEAKLKGNRDLPIIPLDSNVGADGWGFCCSIEVDYIVILPTDYNELVDEETGEIPIRLISNKGNLRYYEVIITRDMLDAHRKEYENFILAVVEGIGNKYQ